jgi:hypothetical protein
MWVTLVKSITKYATSVVNYAEKSFTMLAREVNVITKFGI